MQNVRYHLTRPVVQKVEIHVTVASGSFVKCPVDPGNRHHVVTVVLVDTMAVTLSVAGRGGSGNQIKHVLCSAPSVPQPVVQTRRRPLLGPSPG